MSHFDPPPISPLATPLLYPPPQPWICHWYYHDENWHSDIRTPGMMKLCGANTAVLWLVMSLIFSGCDADHTTRDGMLEKMLEQLQQQNQEIERQNEQLALHSEQNSQIVRHLAELAEQLQVGLPYPNTRRLPNVGCMLGQRRRRWPNIKLPLGGCLIFAGYGE